MFLVLDLFSFVHYDHLLHIVNCSDPTFPGNGSIGTYLNTTEGGEVMFGCNPGFVPTGNMTAVCGAGGRWNPDPGDLTCIGR